MGGLGEVKKVDIVVMVDKVDGVDAVRRLREISKVRTPLRSRAEGSRCYYRHLWSPAR